MSTPTMQEAEKNLIDAIAEAIPEGGYPIGIDIHWVDKDTWKHHFIELTDGTYKLPNRAQLIITKRKESEPS